MADDDKKQELLPPSPDVPAGQLTQPNPLLANLPGPKKNWLGRVTPESVVEHGKFAIEVQTLAGEYARVRGLNETAYERGQVEGQVALHTLKSGLPNAEDVRRTEELKQAEHEAHVAALKAHAERSRREVDDEFAARQFDRDMRRPVPPPPKDETLPPKLTMLGMVVLQAEAARNGTETPSDVQIAAVKSAWNAFEAECKRLAADPSKVMEQLKRAAGSL